MEVKDNIVYLDDYREPEMTPMTWEDILALSDEDLEELVEFVEWVYNEQQ